MPKQTFDFAKFDYTTNRSIFSNCNGTYCPNLEMELVREFLNRKYDVIFVTLNQPHEKIRKSLGETDHKLFLIDAVSAIAGIKEHHPNVLPLPRNFSLTEMSLEIEKRWNAFGEKRFLFFDCGELLFNRFDEKQIFPFVQQVVQRLQRTGIVLFCFLHGTLPTEVHNRLAHLFDQSIDL